MTGDGTWDLRYGGENRPVWVSGVRYAYGPDGMRLKMIDAAGADPPYIGADLELKQGVWTK